jgi:hypothetical protein
VVALAARRNRQKLTTSLFDTTRPNCAVATAYKNKNVSPQSDINGTHSFLFRLQKKAGVKDASNIFTETGKWSRKPFAHQNTINEIAQYGDVYMFTMLGCSGFGHPHNSDHLLPAPLELQLKELIEPTRLKSQKTKPYPLAPQISYCKACIQKQLADFGCAWLRAEWHAMDYCQEHDEPIVQADCKSMPQATDALERILSGECSPDHLPRDNGVKPQQLQVHPHYVPIEEVKTQLFSPTKRYSICAQSLIDAFNSRDDLSETTQLYLLLANQKIFSAHKANYDELRGKLSIDILLKTDHLETIKCDVGYFNSNSLQFDLVIPKNHPCLVCFHRFTEAPIFCPDAFLSGGKSCFPRLSKKEIRHLGMYEEVTFSPMVERGPSAVLDELYRTLHHSRGV